MLRQGKWVIVVIVVSAMLSPGGSSWVRAETGLCQNLRINDAESMDLTDCRGKGHTTPVATCDLVCPAWHASVDYLNWRPRQRGLDFATSEDMTALTLGAGRIHNLDFDRDPGLRANLGYTTKVGWGLHFRFTDFDSVGRALVQMPADGRQAVFVTRGHPDSQLEQAQTAEARGSLDYQVFDIEASRRLCSGQFAEFGVFGGVRWADFQQGLDFRYHGFDFNDARFRSRQDVDVFGLRLGAAAHWKMAGGLSAFGLAAGTVGWGQFQTRLNETNLSGRQDLVDMSDDFDQSLPALDAALGLSWRWRCLAVAGGYEVTNWFNLSNTSTFPDDFLERSYLPSSNDVLLEGCFIRLSATW